MKRRAALGTPDCSPMRRFPQVAAIANAFDENVAKIVAEGDPFRWIAKTGFRCRITNWLAPLMRTMGAALRQWGGEDRTLTSQKAAS